MFAKAAQILALDPRNLASISPRLDPLAAAGTLTLPQHVTAGSTGLRLVSGTGEQAEHRHSYHDSKVKATSGEVNTSNHSPKTEGLKTYFEESA